MVFSLYVYIQIPPSYKAQSSWISVLPKNYNWITSVKAISPSKLHSKVLGVTAYEFVGKSTVQPIIAAIYIFPFLPTLRIRFSPPQSYRARDQLVPCSLPQPPLKTHRCSHVLGSITASSRSSVALRSF